MGHCRLVVTHSLAPSVSARPVYRQCVSRRGSRYSTASPHAGHAGVFPSMVPSFMEPPPGPFSPPFDNADGRYRSVKRQTPSKTLGFRRKAAATRRWVQEVHIGITGVGVLFFWDVF